jgi:hypothetical protein
MGRPRVANVDAIFEAMRAAGFEVYDQGHDMVRIVDGPDEAWIDVVGWVRVGGHDPLASKVLGIIERLNADD